MLSSVERPGNGAAKPPLHRCAGEHHQAAGAVVGAMRAVVGHPPAELGEHQHRDAVVDPAGLEVGDEGTEGAGELDQLRILLGELVAVGVECSPS